MAWEERNGNRYYYRKRRQGKQVISEYVGSRYAGELAEIFDAEDRQTAEYNRRDLRKQQQQAAALDAEASEIEQFTRAYTRACLLLVGYHTHKGQWRKARA
jgi:DNA-binding GntR family transcriptional regulator